MRKNQQETVLPRMRVARECYTMLREADPETRVSERYIRMLAKRGKIPTLRVGNRMLINYDSLLSYLENPPAERPQIGVIRPVAER